MRSSPRTGANDVGVNRLGWHAHLFGANSLTDGLFLGDNGLLIENAAPATRRGPGLAPRGTIGVPTTTSVATGTTDASRKAGTGDFVGAGNDSAVVVTGSNDGGGLWDILAISTMDGVSSTLNIGADGTLIENGTGDVVYSSDTLQASFGGTGDYLWGSGQHQRHRGRQ